MPRNVLLLPFSTNYLVNHLLFTTINERASEPQISMPLANLRGSWRIHAGSLGKTAISRRSRGASTSQLVYELRNGVLKYYSILPLRVNS
jgi:hypothetical protein